MFTKRKDVVVMDKHLIRFESPPEDTRPKYNKGDKNMKLFFTADNHFFHSNMIRFESRPFKNVDDMTIQMIDKWNKKVSKDDSVYILGDFAFGNAEEISKLLDKLNGNKYMIRGNHDHALKDRDLQKKFGWVKDYHMLKYNGLKIVLFHYPIAVWDCKHHGSIHLYGHVHSNKGDHHPLDKAQNNSYNVGVDVNGYEPVSLEEILEKINYKN